MTVGPLARCVAISDASTVDPLALGVQVSPTHEPPLLDPEAAMVTSYAACALWTNSNAPNNIRRDIPILVGE